MAIRAPCGTNYCRSLTKVKFYTDQVRPALGSGSWLIDGWMDGLLTMLKNLKTALFQTFSTWHRILSAFTALYWPSTAFYWPSTTKYQPVPPYTDPVPSWINHYRLILIQCHQVPTSRATQGCALQPGFEEMDRKWGNEEETERD